MARRFSSSIVIVAIVVIPTVAHAQDREGEAGTTSLFELTPHAAIGSGGSPDVGAAVRWPLKARFSVEFESTYRHSQLNALGSSVNLLYDLPSIGKVTPYVAAGVGIDQTPSVIALRQGSLYASLKTAFTVNAGGGVRVPVNDQWGVRTDARWFNGLGRQAPERLRFYNGVTFRPRAR